MSGAASGVPYSEAYDPDGDSGGQDYGYDGYEMDEYEPVPAAPPAYDYSASGAPGSEVEVEPYLSEPLPPQQQQQQLYQQQQQQQYQQPFTPMGAPPVLPAGDMSGMMMQDPLAMQLQMQQQQMQMQMQMMNQQAQYQAAMQVEQAHAAPAPTISVIIESNHEEKRADPPRPAGPSRPRPKAQAPAPPPIPPFIPHVPIFTIMSTLLQVGTFVFMMIRNGGFENPALNPLLGPREGVLLDAGAKYGFFMFVEGEWWRFLTAVFLHSGALHLLGDTIALFRIGWILEKKYGSARIGGIYLISGVGGNLLSTLFLPGVISTASSACLFGYLAVLLLDLLQNFKKMPKRGCRLLTLSLGILFGLAIGLLPFLDNFAHIGGFLTGLLAGIVLIPNLRSTKRWKRVGRCVISVVFVPLLVGFFVGGFLLFYYAVDVQGWCPNCKYLSCVPVYIPPANGGAAQNWCDTGFSFNDVTQALGLPF